MNVDVEAVADEYRAGATIQALADRHGRSYGWMRVELIRSGVELRRQGHRPNRPRVRATSATPKGPR